MVAITGDVPVLVAVNEGTFPLPLEGIAMDGLELVHVYVAPAGVLAKTVDGTTVPLHTVILLGTVTVTGEAPALIVIVFESDIAEHPPDAAIVLTTV